MSVVYKPVTILTIGFFVSNSNSMERKMQNFIPSLIILSALIITVSSTGQALTRKPAKVAVIQATGSPRQDPFLKTYDREK